MQTSVGITTNRTGANQTAPKTIPPKGPTNIGTTTLGNPFCEAKGKVIGTKIIDVNDGPPRVVHSVTEGYNEWGQYFGD